MRESENTGDEVISGESNPVSPRNDLRLMDFLLTLSSLSNDKHIQELENALATIARSEAEGVLLKTELAGIKRSLSRIFEIAWDSIIREPYCYQGRFESLSAEERQLEQSLSQPYPHLLPGFLKRVMAASKADGPMRDDMIAWLGEVVPLAERVNALKEIVGTRVPQPTKTSIARSDREEKAMTCQCCARAIMAETGVIAHHGYTRPGGGYQTASCEGAQEPPFEVSREALGRMIENMRAYKAGREDFLRQAGEETIALPFVWREAPLHPGSRSRERSTPVTRENYGPRLAEIASAAIRTNLRQTFDDLKTSVIARVTHEIQGLEEVIEFEESRYAGWVQTHERDADAWIPVQSRQKMEGVVVSEVRDPARRGRSPRSP